MPTTTKSIMCHVHMIFTHLCICPEKVFTLFGSVFSLRVYQRDDHILNLPSAEWPKPKHEKRQIWAMAVLF